MTESDSESALSATTFSSGLLAFFNSFSSRRWARSRHSRQSHGFPSSSESEDELEDPEEIKVEDEEVEDEEDEEVEDEEVEEVEEEGGPYLWTYQKLLGRLVHSNKVFDIYVCMSYL